MNCWITIVQFYCSLFGMNNCWGREHCAKTNRQQKLLSGVNTRHPVGKQRWRPLRFRPNSSFFLCFFFSRWHGWILSLSKNSGSSRTNWNRSVFSKLELWRMCWRDNTRRTCWRLTTFISNKWKNWGKVRQWKLCGHLRRNKWAMTSQVRTLRKHYDQRSQMIGSTLLTCELTWSY